MLQRTQLMLDREIKQELGKVAVIENRSMSDVVREILKANLPKVKSLKRDGGTGFLIWLSKNAKSGPGDSEYDKYAY